MSDASGPVVETTKQRVTRSSIGQVVSGSSVEDTGATERPGSPARSSHGSLATTPTQDAPGGSAELTTPESSSSTSTQVKRTKMGVVPATSPQTTRRSLRSSNKLNTDEESDQYCWRCRKDGSVIPCQLCPRVYHIKCLDLVASPVEDWICVECEKIMRSEHEDTKPRALVNLSMEHLITCLQYALERMKVPNSEVFQVPVDPAMEPEYHNIIAHPMDMSQLEKNIKKKVYGSTQAFLADAMWILHNSVLYNGMHNKYTMTAKAILKMCRHQMTEIETCPDCFLASCTQEPHWFCKPCRFSHPLVWAKLKGYPFWPAKALRENDGQVDCRFFGAHDKAWLPANSVFMLSSEPPAPVKNKKGSGFEEAMVELDKYVTRFKARYGTFTYAPAKEPYRSDYGQPAALEAKKRKMTSPGSASEAPQSKKPLENVVKQEPVAVKEEKLAIKVEPDKPGVFTISDDLLADASNFSLVKDEEVMPTPSSNVVSKIEETLKLAQQDADVTRTNGDIKMEDADEKDDIKTPIETTPSRPVSSPQIVAKLTTPSVSTDITSVVESVKPVGPPSVTESTKPCESSDEHRDSAEVKTSSSQPTQSTESTPPSTTRPATPSTTRPTPQSTEPTPQCTEPAPQSTEPTPPSNNSTEATNPVKPSTSQVVEPIASTSESMDTSVTQSFTTTDTEYTEKLERTIASCKNSLGLNDVQEMNEWEESESESESESEEEVSYSGGKRRYSRTIGKRRQRLDVREAMSEKEKEVTRQLLRVIRESLHPTLKGVVRQTLLGQTPVANPNNAKPAAVDDESQLNIPSTSAADTPAADAPSDAAKPVDPGDSMKLPHATLNVGVVPKSEPLSENLNNENSLDSGGDPSVGKELAEKLTWKHKCEIEAVKHNAELASMEMRKSIELEKERALWRLRKQLEHKFKKIIEETKKKQWCAMCGKEAIFYCCWNTSYCDYPCQQKHWPNHLKTCAQISKDDGEKKSAQQHPRTQSPGSSNSERTPQSVHSSSAPPPYMPASSSAAGELSPAPQQYQLMQGQQVQYMPAPGSVPPNVYQAQLPVQAMPMQSGPRIPVSASGAPMLYPVMTPPAPQGPPQPQSYLLSQRQPYRLAPKYS